MNRSGDRTRQRSATLRQAVGMIAALIALTLAAGASALNLVSQGSVDIPRASVSLASVSMPQMLQARAGTLVEFPAFQRRAP